MVKQGKLTAILGVVCPTLAAIIRLMGLTGLGATDILQWRDFLGDLIELIPEEAESWMLDNLQHGLQAARRLTRDLRRRLQDLFELLIRRFK